MPRAALAFNRRDWRWKLFNEKKCSLSLMNFYVSLRGISASEGQFFIKFSVKNRLCSPSWFERKLEKNI